VGRALRIDAPGAFYHVTSRGNGGRAIYFDDRDRRVFLAMFARVRRRYGWVCLAFCLMTNHYHLLLETPDGGLSGGMRELNGGYARRTNRRYAQDGHLFRNRFGAETLEREEHLLEACRYIVLNPVRAGLCSDPADWPWSSYRACAGLEYAPHFLAVDRVLRLFGRSPAAARRAYRAFVAAVSDTVTKA
jgi:putative transposase